MLPITQERKMAGSIDLRQSPVLDNFNIIGEFQNHILSSVLHLKTAYGVQIRDYLAAKLDRDIHLPQVYTALAKMEIAGLLEGKVQNKTSAGLNTRGRPRRIYTITAPGLRMLNAREQYLSKVHQVGEPDGVPNWAATA